ncbi:fungal-specific transcription factor domain-containing protein [Lasiosphaeria ovina]|uniref:Fungal-specific transcription factor domain-containing protein n=1 Tax=Lasiosphaeria ovina TaxID=92902 RepID=A0AAE0N7R3_9PEZI|nr:fungal-specific transcription factor domain-containing protein [Lasiosphaeria ovina]
MTDDASTASSPGVNIPMSADESPGSPTLSDLSHVSDGPKIEAVSPCQLSLKRRSSSSLKGDEKENGNGNVNGNDKRPKPAPNSGKVTKRRAAKACSSCRTRKVRCDVVEHAPGPCGNCKWDGVECIVQESRRRKKANMLNAVRMMSTDNAEASQPTGGLIPMAAADLLEAQTALSQRGAGGARMQYGAHLDAQRASQILAFRNYRTPAGVLAPQFSGPNGHYQCSHPAPNQSTSFGNSNPRPRAGPMPDLPDLPDVGNELLPFMKPFPAKIDEADLQYLRRKDALALPVPKLESALISAFVEFVHPYIPVLDLDKFLGVVSQRDGQNDKVSLLLYQAVLFAGAAFVDAGILRESGYTSRKEARKYFFSRVKIIYDMDYETDNMVLVQSLLMMTYWYETPNESKDTWHWLGIAVSLALMSGLHRDPKTLPVPPRDYGLRKRIWWSLYMRDRLVALGMRRPTRIKEEDCSVPMLQESDFDIRVIAVDIAPQCVLLRDTTMQHQLAMMCIEKAKLCVCISHMLDAQYTVITSEILQPNNDVSLLLYPKKSLSNRMVVEKVHDELEGWLNNLPDCCVRRPLTLADIEEGKKAVAVHRSLLHMIYHTTFSALHRPQFLPAPQFPIPPGSAEVQELAKKRVNHAADQNITLGRELHRLGLDRYIPTTGVTVFLPALLIQLYYIRDEDPAVVHRAKDNFRDGAEVMKVLSESYPAASFGLEFLTAALARFGLDGSWLQDGAASSRPWERPVQMANSVTPPAENATYLDVAKFQLPLDPSMMHRFYSAEANPTQLEPARGMAMAMTPPAMKDPIFSDVTDLPTGGHNGQEGVADSSHPETNAEFNFDSWLHYPAEGVSNNDEQFINVFYDTEQTPGHESTSYANTTREFPGVGVFGGPPIGA